MLLNFSKRNLLITDLEAPVSKSVDIFVCNGLKVSCVFLNVYLDYFIVCGVLQLGNLNQCV